jgi:hypothetical protein
MEKLMDCAIKGYAEQYLNLTQHALAKIVEIVKAQQGRITLFAMRDTWDDDASKVRDEVRDNSVELRIDNGGGNVTMYPIDFLEDNGYVSVLLADEYGDYPRIYADKMHDATICVLADFLVKSFGHRNILKIVDIYYTQLSKDFIAFIRSKQPAWRDVVLGSDLYDLQDILLNQRENSPYPDDILAQLSVFGNMLREQDCRYFRLLYPDVKTILSNH